MCVITSFITVQDDGVTGKQFIHSSPQKHMLWVFIRCASPEVSIHIYIFWLRKTP